MSLIILVLHLRNKLKNIFQTTSKHIDKVSENVLCNNNSSLPWSSQCTLVLCKHMYVFIVRFHCILYRFSAVMPLELECCLNKNIRNIKKHSHFILFIPVFFSTLYYVSDECNYIYKDFLSRHLIYQRRKKTTDKSNTNLKLNKMRRAKALTLLLCTLCLRKIEEKGV